MAGPLLNTCCRCQPLRVGAIIAGVGAILLAIVSLVILFVVRAEFKTIVLDWLPQWVVKTVLAVNLCMTIIISIVLIIGVLKKNHFLMLPWVILGFMVIISLVISVIYTAVIFFIDGYILAGVLWIVVGIICVLIYLYMWAVVYSQFTVLKEELQRGKYTRQPYRR